MNNISFAFVFLLFMLAGCNSGSDKKNVDYFLNNYGSSDFSAFIGYNLWIRGADSDNNTIILVTEEGNTSCPAMLHVVHANTQTAVITNIKTINNDSCHSIDSALLASIISKFIRMDFYSLSVDRKGSVFCTVRFTRGKYLTRLTDSIAVDLKDWKKLDYPNWYINSSKTISPPY